MKIHPNIPSIRSMSEKRPRKGWGGKRKGAGRPRIMKAPKRLIVDIEETDLSALRALASERETSVPHLVRRAVSQYLRRVKKG